MKKRKYQQVRRAAQQESTRQQIIAAAAALHESLGPAQTSIKAVAEKAGVQRLTVYRHFPDDNSLFLACTQHWLQQNPPPDIPLWASEQDPSRRTHKALSCLYRYYRGTETMWRQSYRDLDKVEALVQPMLDFETLLLSIRDDLLAHWAVDARQQKDLSHTLSHCLYFPTWQSFRKMNLADEEAVELALKWIHAVL